MSGEKLERRCEYPIWRCTGCRHIAARDDSPCPRSCQRRRPPTSRCRGIYVADMLTNVSVGDDAAGNGPSRGLGAKGGPGGRQLETSP